MRERPILFSGEMVKAILEGRKCMTRRVNSIGEYYLTNKKCPYGSIGDRLWVRETFIPIPREDITPKCILWDIQYVADGEIKEGLKAPSNCNPMLYNYYRPTPSIFMPRWASRITLKITDIRVERLQDITEEDAEKEGMPDDYPIPSVYCPRCAGLGSRSLRTIETGCPNCDTPKKRFKNLWDRINDREHGKTWDANPWVWVIEFSKEEAE